DRMGGVADQVDEDAHERAAARTDFEVVGRLEAQLERTHATGETGGRADRVVEAQTRARLIFGRHAVALDGERLGRELRCHASAAARVVEGLEQQLDATGVNLRREVVAIEQAAAIEQTAALEQAAALEQDRCVLETDRHALQDRAQV